MTDAVQTLYGTFDEKQLKSLKGFIDEMCIAMGKAKALSESISDIISITHEELKIPKKIVRRMARVQFKQSLQEEVAEFVEFEALFKSISEVK